MGKCSLSFPSPSFHPPTLFSGYHVSCANQYFIAVAPEQWSPPPPSSLCPSLPPSLQLSEWQIRVRMSVGGQSEKREGCRRVWSGEWQRKHEVTRNGTGERGRSVKRMNMTLDKWPESGGRKNVLQIMKLCSENVSQFPCFQRTNYRTKRENVSFMTSKLGRCRLIFPLFVSCVFSFFVYFYLSSF